MRIYSCGPTVYQRIHVGNAVPFVFAMWLRRWLQHTGYDVQLAINITDVNDKIYEAAPGKSAELARDATEWYLEDTSGLGLGRPDFEPRATGTIPEQVAMIEQLIDAGFAYEVDGDVYYRVSRFPEYGRLSGQRPDKVEEQEPNPRKEDPRDFALWKANKPGEDTSWDSPWGKGRPGWHIECSAMSEKHLGTEFEVHGGGLDLVFPHHENELAQSRALGHRFAKIWMHNGLLRLRRRGDAQVAREHRSRSRTRSRRGGGRRCSSSMRPATGASRSTSRTRRSGRRRRGQRASATSFARRREPAPEGSWERFAAALDDDFNTPEALAVMHEWRDHDLLRRALEIFGLESLAELPEAPAGGGRARARAGAGPRRAPLRRRRRAAQGDRGGRLDRSRLGRRVPARPQVVTREQVYGRRPVREALRGRRAVLELWATERALAAEPWLRENGKRVHVKQERELSEAADTRDHQGVLAWVEPYKYADAHELAAVAKPLIVALDQVSDPHNLGAVIRTAEAAGATGVVVPAHGSARVTPAVARASAGAVEHLPVAVVTNLARYLGEVKSGDLWVVGAAGDAPRSMWESDLSGGLALVFGAEGKGLRPLVRRTCDELVSIPLEGTVESLNVSVAAGVLVYEAKRQRA